MNESQKVNQSASALAQEKEMLYGAASRPGREMRPFGRRPPSRDGNDGPRADDAALPYPDLACSVWKLNAQPSNSLNHCIETRNDVDSGDGVESEVGCGSDLMQQVPNPRVSR